MNLTRKITTSLVLAAISVVIIFIFVSHYYSDNFFTYHDSDYMQNNILQMQNILKKEVQTIETFNITLSKINATKKFALNPQQEYANDILSESVLSRQQINFVVFFDSTSKLIASKTLRSFSIYLADEKTFANNLIKELIPLLTINNKTNMPSGFFRMNDRVFILSVSPIKDTDAFVVSGRTIDNSFFNMFPNINPSMVDLPDINDKSENTNDVEIHHLDNAILATIKVKDIKNESIFAIQLKKKNSYVHFLKSISFIALIIIVLFSMVIFNVMLRILRKHVNVPIRQLASQMDGINLNKRLSVPADSDKNIIFICNQINVFLDGIEHSIDGIKFDTDTLLQENKELKKQVSGLKNHKKNFDKLINIFPIPTFLVNSEHKITHWNRACEKLCKISEQQIFNTYNHRMPFFPEEQKILSDYLLDESPFNEIKEMYGNTLKKSDILDNALELEQFFPELGPDGKWIYITSAPIYNEDGKPISVLETFRDISKRKTFEQEKLQYAEHIKDIQRLDSLENMAGGIAHDFNNLLTGILGNASLASLETGENVELQEYLREIEMAAEKASELAKQMLAYSGKGHFFFSRFNLVNLLDSMKSTLYSIAPDNTEITIDSEDDLLSLKADESQIRQLILSIATNAIEAIDNEREGKVQISISKQFIEEKEIQSDYLDIFLQQGVYVCIKIKDNGRGIDPAIKHKIFEPFFSTKFTGRGLGLAASIGVIKGHNGGILFENNNDKGTTCTIYLPSNLIDTHETQVHQHEIAKTNDPVILVVDDQIILQQFSKKVLEHENCKIITANNGEEAIQIYKSSFPFVDLVLLDYIMPKTDGLMVLKKLYEFDKKVKVIIASEYSDKLMKEIFIGQQPEAFIQKPFRPEELSTLVKKILETNNKVD